MKTWTLLLLRVSPTAMKTAWSSIKKLDCHNAGSGLL